MYFYLFIISHSQNKQKNLRLWFVPRVNSRVVDWYQFGVACGDIDVMLWFLWSCELITLHVFFLFRYPNEFVVPRSSELPKIMWWDFSSTFLPIPSPTQYCPLVFQYYMIYQWICCRSISSFYRWFQSPRHKYQTKRHLHLEINKLKDIYRKIRIVGTYDIPYEYCSSFILWIS